MTEFSLLQRECLPSDHTPISVTMTLPGVDMESLCTRANHLGDHAVTCNESGRNKHVKKPVHWKAIDEEMVLSNLQSADLPTEIYQVEQVIQHVSDNLYDCMCRSRWEPQAVYGKPTSERWERLLENKMT